MNDKDMSWLKACSKERLVFHELGEWKRTFSRQDQIIISFEGEWENVKKFELSESFAMSPRYTLSTRLSV